MKKITALLLALMMCLGLCACQKTATSTDTTSATTNTPTSESSATDASDEEPTSVAPVFPVTITDQAGREVTIEKEPERIVSGYYISTSIVMALGRTDRLVGIEAKAEKRKIYKLGAPELIDLPNVGTAKEFDLEGCAALEPDVVILPLKLKDAAQTLTELGIPVILVNPESQKLLTESINIIAKALGTAEKEAALTDYIDSRLSELSEKLKDAPRPTVYLAGNSSLLSTAGSAMYQNMVLEYAGAVNVAESFTDKYWCDIDYEQLLTWNPDYIILASDASYTIEDVLNDANLSALDAVKNARVYKISDDVEAWDSPVPGGFLGSIWIASMIHPDIVSPDDAQKASEDFYEAIYNFKYTTQE